MTKDTDNAFTDVAGLMAQRQQFEAWLAALDARRDSTPRHVFQRVRADYEARLREVLSHLSTHRGDIEERLGALTKRVSELETEEKARRDEREELELRAQVGELSREAYEKAAADCDRQIAEISALHTSVREELLRTQAFLGEATRPSPALQQAAVPTAPTPTSAQGSGSAAPAGAGASAKPDRADEKPVAAAAGKQGATANPPRGTPVAQPAAPADSGGAKRGPHFDELAFLNAVVGDGEAEGQPPRNSTERAAVKDGEATPAKPETQASRPEPRTSQPQPRASRPHARVPRPEPRPSRSEPPDPGPHRSSKPDWIAKEPGETLEARTPSEQSDIEHDEPEPLAANISGNHPIVLRSSGQVDQAKTLKCAECGAMNYPTEWYCERCGAELAAL